MFYLGHLIQVFGRYPARAGFFVVMTLILASVTLIPTEKLGVSHQAPVEMDYFHALINGKENHSRLSRNLTDLPQVARVELLSENDIREQVQQVLGQLKTKVADQLMQFDYAGLKVIYHADATTSSKELVRDYLVRLAGAANVTLGHVVETKRETQNSSGLMDYLFWGSLGGLCVLWLLAAQAFLPKLAEASYLVEEFQRRHRVALKSYGFFYAPLLFVMVTGAAIGTAPWTLTIGLLVMMACPLVLLRKKYIW